MTIFSDKSFSRKLERAEAVMNANFVETRARIFPASGAEWIDVGGVYAMFDGVASPLTQTFGLGVASPFIAELDGKPIATGMLFICDGVAQLGGASTILEGRRLGAQNALLEARPHFAREQGCRLATMGAQPGSQSQRNAGKNGFRVAYTRTKWQLKR